MEILGLRVDSLDMQEVVLRVQAMIRSGRACQVVTLNAEMAMMAQDDPELFRIINEAGLVVADGAGIVWASRILGSPVPERVAGFDLMVRLLCLAEQEGHRPFFLGARPGIAEKAVERLTFRHPGLTVAGTHHGYFPAHDEDTVVNKINEARPDLLFVALGVSKQEKWIARNMGRLKPVVCIGVGGSFDVLAGHARRAPGWVGRLGLEWLYRLACEPRRAGRMLALPRFMWAVVLKGR